MLGVIGSIGRTISSIPIIGSSPIGLVAGVAGGLATTLRGPGPRVQSISSGGMVVPQGPVFTPSLPQGTRVQVPTPGAMGAIQRFLPGGATGFTTLPGAVGPGGILGAMGATGGITGAGDPRAGMNGVCAPRGFHFAKDGSGRLVKNRRRFNPANGAAQKRAVSRLTGAEGHAKDLLRAVGYRTLSKQSSREIRNRSKASCK